MDDNICRLCGNNFLDEEMSEEHYPAKSVGNEDIVLFDIAKMFDSLKLLEHKKFKTKDELNIFMDNNFEKCVAKNLFPQGRTARTLCKKCNQFLGKYDESYLKFFNVNGDCNSVKGFSKQTKLNIIKAIYGKFLSLPEAATEKFDFLEFVKDVKNDSYQGEWNLYFIKRNHTTDLMGMPDIGTGKEFFDRGIVYELSDEKFIFNLLNFEKHDSIEMTNIFEILNKNYTIVEGVSEKGSYHESIFLSRMFKQMYENDR